MPDDFVPPESSGGGAIITRKLGPLPTWTWVVIGAGVILFIRSRKKGGASTSPGGTTEVSTPVNSPLGYSSGADSAGVNSFLSNLQNELATIQAQNGTPTTAPAGYTSTPPATPGGTIAGGPPPTPAPVSGPGPIAQAVPNDAAYNKFGSVPTVFGTAPTFAVTRPPVI